MAMFGSCFHIREANNNVEFQELPLVKESAGMGPEYFFQSRFYLHQDPIAVYRM
jgi:hypothetical protein